MSRLFDPALAVEMDIDSWGRPTRFTLLGRQHKLVRALQHWQVDTDWWHADGGVHREYWAVTTSGGLLCVVYKELEGQGGWFLAKMYD